MSFIGLGLGLGNSHLSGGGMPAPLTAPDFTGFTFTIPDVIQGTEINIPIANSGGAVDSYTINNSPPGASIVNNVFTYTANTLNTYNDVSVYGENIEGDDVTNASSFTVHEQLSITTQLNSQTVTEGQTATFTMTASGVTGGYQMQVYNGSNWVNVAGAITNSYITDPTVLADNGTQYRMKAFGALGQEVISNVVTLTVNAVVSTNYLKRVYDAYQGYPYVTATDMTLVLDAHKTTVAAPCVIQCSIGNSTISGTTITGAPIVPAMAEARWRVTKSNGEVVANWVNNGKGTFLPTTGKYINDYTDQVSPMARFPIYDPSPDTYTVTCVARIPDGSGGYIVRSESIDIVVTAGFVGYDQYFFNKVTGDDANTGHDPFGSVYTGATYDNSTGILTATGAFATAFANQIAQSATVSPLHRNNYHYFNSDGVTRRGEYLDNDRFQVVLEDRDAGIPSTGLTSVASDGPKQEYYNKNDFSQDNVVYHLDGNGGASHYEMIQARFGQKLHYDDAFMVGYNFGSNDGVELRYTGPSTINAMVFSDMENVKFLSNIILNANELAGGVEALTNSTTATNEWGLILDNSEVKNNRSIISIRASDGSLTTRPSSQLVAVGGKANNKNITGVDKQHVVLYTMGNGSWVDFNLGDCVGDSERPVFDHYIYNNGTSDRERIWGVDAHGADPAHEPEYFVNSNAHSSSPHDRKLLVVSDCVAMDCKYFVDASASDNQPTSEWFDSVLVSRNHVRTKSGFALYYNARNMIPLQNVLIGTDSTTTSHPKLVNSGVEANVFAHGNIIIDGMLNETINSYASGPHHREMLGNIIARYDEVLVDSFKPSAWDSKHRYENQYFSSIGEALFSNKDFSNTNQDLATIEPLAEASGSVMANTILAPDFQDKDNKNFLPVGYGSTAPTISTQPAATSVANGEIAVFWVEGSEWESIAWFADGVEVPNTNGPVFFRVSAGVDIDVRVELTNGTDTTVSNTVTMTATGGLSKPTSLDNFDLADANVGDTGSLDVTTLFSGQVDSYGTSGTLPPGATLTGTTLTWDYDAEDTYSDFAITATNAAGTTTSNLDSVTISAAPASYNVNTLTYDDRSGFISSPDVTAFDYIAGGESMISGHTDGYLRVREVTTAYNGTTVTTTVTSSLNFGQTVTDIKIVDNGNKVSVVGADKKIHIINLASPGTLVGATLGPVSANALFILGGGHEWVNGGLNLWVPERVDDRVNTHHCGSPFDPSDISSMTAGESLVSEDGNLDTIAALNDNEVILANSSSGEFYQYETVNSTTDDMTLVGSNTTVTSESNNMDGISIGGGFLTTYKGLRFRKFDF